VADDQLRKMLGIANVSFKQNEQRPAIIDSPLQRACPGEVGCDKRGYRDDDLLNLVDRVF
jgi:hypothetical protein